VVVINVFDRVVNAVNPVAGLKRYAARRTLKVLNTGYGDGGASLSKKALKGFTGISASPAQDIDANHRILVNRSRELYMNTPIGASAIKTTRTNVVGSGLRLKPRIDYEFLGLTQEQAIEWEKTVQREFDLWADTKLCDSLRLNNFYEMQGLVFLGQLMNGDGFCLLKFQKPSWFMPYGLRLQLLEADRVCTPYTYGIGTGNSLVPYWGRNPQNNNEIYSGVEIDSDGGVLAYWICNQYPYQMTTYNFTAPAWTRVEAWGAKTGRPNVLHLFDAERAEQRRGVPMLAPVIEPLLQLGRYTEAELMAAVVSGMFTVFIKTEGPSSEMPLGEGIPIDAVPVETDETEYQLGNGAVVPLGLNESIEVADPKRPNVVFDAFITAICKEVGAALEIPTELLLKSFTSSYSASRAALLEAWKMFRMRRGWLAQGFCQPVYEQFLTEAVASGRIKAPKFFDDPIIRKAWCGATWNGPAPGMLDPTKEVSAAKMRVDNGFSTREEETVGLTGGDYARNIQQLQKENQLLAEANKSLNPVMPSGPGAIPALKNTWKGNDSET